MEEGFEQLSHCICLLQEFHELGSVAMILQLRPYVTEWKRKISHAGSFSEKLQR